nr:MAG TPA: hypothetical protein [Caudoviricetes sp.]
MRLSDCRESDDNHIYFLLWIIFLLVSELSLAVYLRILIIYYNAEE